jgi:hypothetical protein
MGNYGILLREQYGFFIKKISPVESILHINFSDYFISIAKGSLLCASYLHKEVLSPAKTFVGYSVISRCPEISTSVLENTSLHKHSNPKYKNTASSVLSDYCATLANGLKSKDIKKAALGTPQSQRVPLFKPLQKRTAEL